MKESEFLPGAGSWILCWVPSTLETSYCQGASYSASWVLQGPEWVRQASQNHVVEEGRGKENMCCQASMGLHAWESRGGCACSHMCMKTWCLCSC